MRYCTIYLWYSIKKIPKIIEWGSFKKDVRSKIAFLTSPVRACSILTDPPLSLDVQFTNFFLFLVHDVSYNQGCQIKILEIGIFLPKIGKYRKMHLAKSEKKSESDFQAFQSLSWIFSVKKSFLNLIILFIDIFHQC